MTLAILVPVEASQTHPLTVGDPVSGFRFEDIQGQQAATQDYPGWTIIYTFADRKSNKILMEWIVGAGETVAKNHPDRKMAYINFADTKSVPRIFRSIAESMLKNIHVKTLHRIRESYRRAGITDSSERLAFHVVPDWNGTFLESFGIQDASTYWIWMVEDGQVLTALSGADPNVKQKFIRSFDVAPCFPASTFKNPFSSGSNSQLGLRFVRQLRGAARTRKIFSQKGRFSPLTEPRKPLFDPSPDAFTIRCNFTPHCMKCFLFSLL